MGVVFQNELFQEEERPLVIHLASETATVKESAETNNRMHAPLTFCRSCTTDCQVSLAATRWQFSHVKFSITYSTTNACCKMVPANTYAKHRAERLDTIGTRIHAEIEPQLTSFCTVSLVLMRLEWGSVHTNAASTSLTLFNPRKRLMHTVRSSRDSHAHAIHVRGGCR